MRFRSCCRSASRKPLNGARPLDVYRALRVINPSPYMFHLEFPRGDGSPARRPRRSSGSRTVASSCGRSPARARAASTPADDERLADGTARRSERARRAPDADRPRAQRRRTRGLGGRQRPRSPSSSRSRSYSHVMHMTSHVDRSSSPPDKTWLDVLRAAFPAGTLSGAPKIRAMEIIDELEPHAARHLRRRGRLHQLHRQPRSGDRDPHARQSRRFRSMSKPALGSSPTRSPRLEYQPRRVNKARAVSCALSRWPAPRDGHPMTRRILLDR